MDMKLVIAITAITLALVFYTIGVFAERRAKCLKKFHVIIFWLGLLCDTTGTVVMSMIAKGRKYFRRNRSAWNHRSISYCAYDFSCNVGNCYFA